MSTPPDPRSLRTKIAVGVALLAALVTVTAWVLASVVARTASHDAADHASAVISTQLATGCDRSNLLRAWQRVRARTAPAEKDAQAFELDSDAYFRTLDCQATYHKGREDAAPVFLTSALDECFVALVQQHYFRTHEPFSSPSRLRPICARLVTY
jgi:hypothetical protein